MNKKYRLRTSVSGRLDKLLNIDLNNTIISEKHFEKLYGRFSGELSDKIYERLSYTPYERLWQRIFLFIFRRELFLHIYIPI